MRAAFYETKGPAREVLRVAEQPAPMPGPGEVRVRIKASGVNPSDVKSRRRGVLIDANQNGEGKTIASVYSVRPRDGAPVSTPLRWDEVDDSLDFRTFTMDVVRERIEKQGDLYEGVLTTKQLLGPALRKLQ